jgi:MinD-like ATPase involved in chromosome partitioning or flagellar assembly
LETDEELSFDTVAPRRNGATLAALDDADRVLVVGTGDAIGLQRLVRALDDLRDAGIITPTEIVLNRVRDAAVPGRPASELTGALQRFANRTPAALLPADPAALDAALIGGRLLSEAAPRSPLRMAVRELAGALAGVSVGGGTPRRRHARGGRGPA